jgi:hypothetical protein
LATTVFRKYGVPPRQYRQQAAALLKWVQDPSNVYYVNEAGERLQDPIFTIEHKIGDCFAKGTLLLRNDFELVPVEDVKIGEKIWGKDRWSTVTNFWEKGELPVTHIHLTDGSTIKLTEEHKVYVRSCQGPKKGDVMGNGVVCGSDHGPLCFAGNGWKQCIDRYGETTERILVSALKEGMILLRPKNIVQDKTNPINNETSWLIGAYVAEGWKEDCRISISGKDGHWKEATKHQVKAYCDRVGWHSRWHEKYISINNREAVDLMNDCGGTALTKRISPNTLRNGDAASLDSALQLDASKNSCGEAWTFGTISYELAIQYRILQRIQGRNTSLKKVENHGGFGKNPIYRIGVRGLGEHKADRVIRVKAIQREAEIKETFDIETDDHYVYLPEADTTVSNCDDQSLLLTCLFESIKLPWRLCLSGRHSVSGLKVRHIEGDPVPDGVNWTHIYCMVGTPPFNPTEWWYCEPTIQGVPLGWDVIDGDKAYLPEMDNRKGGTVIHSAPRAPRGFVPSNLPAEKQRSPAYAEAWSGDTLDSLKVELAGDLGGSTSSLAFPIAVGTATAEGVEFQWNWKKFWFGIATGAGVAIMTQLSLDVIRRATGLAPRG